MAHIHSSYIDMMLSFQQGSQLDCHCTLFRKAYILSGSGFHKFLYSMIESLKKFVKLLSLFLISCVFTKKTEGAKKGQKFVKIGTGKNIGSPEQCAMWKNLRILLDIDIFFMKNSVDFWHRKLTLISNQCTLFRKAYILSGSDFNKFSAFFCAFSFFRENATD